MKQFYLLLKGSIDRTVLQSIFDINTVCAFTFYFQRITSAKAFILKAIFSYLVLTCIAFQPASFRVNSRPVCESQSLYTVHHRSSQKGLRSLCYTGLTDNNVLTVMHCIPIRKVSRSVCGQLQKSLYKRRLVNFVHLKSVLIRKILNKDIRRYYCGMSIIDF